MLRTSHTQRGPLTWRSGLSVKEWFEGKKREFDGLPED